MRLRPLVLTLLLVGCEAPPAVGMEDAPVVPPDAFVCEQPARFCVDDATGAPVVGASVIAEATGEDSFRGTTESNGCVLLDLPHRAWSVSARTAGNCTSAPTFTNVTGCVLLTVTLAATTCP